MVSYVATATLAVGLLTTTPQPPEWQADYGKALAETRADDQPLLVVLDKPTSDDARIDPALLGEGEASGRQTEQLRRYRLCHVDVSTNYGKKVARAFKADRFPYTAIIDKSGSVILFAKSGKIEPDEWQHVLKSHRNGERPGLVARAAKHVSYKLGGEASEPSPAYYRSPRNCPSCQRRSM